MCFHRIFWLCHIYIPNRAVFDLYLESGLTTRQNFELIYGERMPEVDDQDHSNQDSSYFTWFGISKPHNVVCSALVMMCKKRMGRCLCDGANMEDDKAGMMMLHTWGWGVFVMKQTLWWSKIKLCDGATLRLQEAFVAPWSPSHISTCILPD